MKKYNVFRTSKTNNVLSLLLYIGRIGNFKKCMHRCCPNIEFCSISTCVKLCRGSKSRTVIGPDGKYKQFKVLQIFSNQILFTHTFVPEILDGHFYLQ